MKNSRWTKGSMIAAIAAAVVGSLCCIGPLIVILLGLGGAWIGTLDQLHAFHPYAVAITALFLVIAFWQLYIRPRRCKDNAVCALPTTIRIQRIIFWVVLVLAILLLSFPYYGQWLI